MGGFNPTNNPANRTIASSLVIGENVLPRAERRPFIGFMPEFGRHHRKERTLTNNPF
jgi:hypothetical protein